MHLELGRIAWSMASFNIMVNKQGHTVKLTDFSPKAVQQMMERDHNATMQEETAKHQVTGEQLTMQPLKRLAASKKYSPVQRGLVRTFAT